jgi:hypothetical protein
MADDIEKSKLDAEAYRDALKEASVIAAESRQTFNDIGASLSNNAKINKEFASTFRTAQKDVGQLSASAAKLSQYGKQDVSNAKVRNNIAKELAVLAKKRAQAEATLAANSIKLKNAKGEERQAILESNQSLLDALNTSDDLTKSFSSTKEQIQEINKSTGFIDKLAEGMKILPVIGPLLAGPLTNLSKGIAQFKVGIDSSLTGAEKTAAQLERAKNVTDALGKGAIAFVVAGLVKADTATTNFAKSLGISKSEAREVGDEMNTFAVNSGKAYVTVEKLMHAQEGLADALGASRGYTNDQLQDQIMLTKKVGLQGEEAANLLKLGLAQGKSSEIVSEEILNSVSNLEKETGIRLQGQKVLKEVATATGQLGAQYGFNNKALAEAVIISNKLGLSLKETQAIAKGLLDFESSITSELEAELLTGKSLNLERARGLALQGKSAEATEEIVKQMGSAADFANLNVIAQDSLAKAAGMTSDQLADTLRNQETLNALGAKNIEQLAKAGNLDKLRGTENGKLLLQQYQQQSAQEKLADVMTKIQSVMANFADPLMGLIDGFAKVAENATAVKIIIGLITTAMVAQAAFKAASTITQIALQRQLLKTSIQNATATTADAAAEGAKSVAKIPYVGGFLALGIGAAIFGGLIGYLAGAKNGNDIMSPGGSGYGSRTLFGPEGAIALNNKDTVIAGTNLFPKENDVVKPNLDIFPKENESIKTSPQPIQIQPQQQPQPQTTVVQQDNSKLEKLLERAINRPDPIIQMNGDDLGTAVGKYAYSVQ